MLVLEIYNLLQFVMLVLEIYLQFVTICYASFRDLQFVTICYASFRDLQFVTICYKNFMGNIIVVTFRAFISKWKNLSISSTESLSPPTFLKIFLRGLLHLVQKTWGPCNIKIYIYVINIRKLKIILLMKVILG